MTTLEEGIDRLAVETRFSGVVRADRGGRTVLCTAYGAADRAHAIANSTEGQFAIASGTKALTALTLVSLVEDGPLELATTARSLLGPDLPLVSDDVTIEDLLGHRSGIGDYLDEEAGYDVDDHVLAVPAHELTTTERYLSVLDGHPQKWAPGTRFAYCNSGYVLLALIAERATSSSFYELVEERVCAPAGMRDTAFLRTDSLPGDAALGYLSVDGLRTNVLHLPVRGSGDGGAYSTATDVHAMWDAVSAGRIVSKGWVARMVEPRSHAPAQRMRYGLGFWLHESQDVVMLLGSDAGVSFRTVHDPVRCVTHTVLSNTSRGAWPVTRLLDEVLLA